ncbi:hypothetical protein [Methylobacterium sp. E-046]|uniref:hypothetical protein n=1 Tax=Methylobacterium sp. E-046 TaxID=2836576 RepID=UPI001FB8B62F|nr:hypothetical protein [Methylobacterium sp. E-046]MCJ2101840.1 hypothetical protein [Methylobacterium sp. E-046]
MIDMMNCYQIENQETLQIVRLIQISYSYMLVAFQLRASWCSSPRRGVQQMTILMSAALALIVIGAAIFLCTFKYAPVTEDFAGWDLACVGGISTAALGGLGALVLLFTT